MCGREGKYHYVDTKRFGHLKGACGQRHQLGCWFNHERIGRGPYLLGSVCKACLKWLAKNEPEFLVYWEQSKELCTIRFAQLNKINRKNEVVEYAKA